MIQSRRMSKRRLALVASLAIAATSLAGCLLTSSFDNVAGVRPDAALPPPVEAGNDGGDEAGEAGDASDAATPFSCATQVPRHFICSDFDEGSLTAGGWTLSQSGAGSARLDTMDFSSPPGALLSKLPALFDTTTSSGILFQNVKNIAPKAVHMAFDMRLQ